MSRKQIKQAYDTNTGELLPQPRGFRYRRVDDTGRGVYTRLGYKAVKCKGEAHLNAHIDNCSLCMSGLWGIAAVKLPPTVKACPPKGFI